MAYRWSIKMKQGGSSVGAGRVFVGKERHYGYLRSIKRMIGATFCRKRRRYIEL
ncbi:hypothetical protein [Aquimarina longa]|uniref:hypothetical protein n=1 Tax=Aquimarina longa TaxID=1080221 RepID=UPI000AC580C8|nr:hypothetical protein [Aquimarina longa]